MRRLLVTGGTGYLGGELVRQAVLAGWEVTATYLSTEPPAVTAAHWCRLDVTDGLAVPGLVGALDPDAVIHTAYLREGPRAEEVTVGGAATVARAARASGARLLQLSTDVVFDGERAGRYAEDDPPRPVSRYGTDKVAAERAVLAADPHALVVRTSLLYGGPAPGPPEVAALEAAQGERDEVFFADEVRCPTQVGDLAAAGLATDRLRAGNSRDLGLVRPRNCALDSSRAARIVTAPPRGVFEVLGAPDGRPTDRAAGAEPVTQGNN